MGHKLRLLIIEDSPDDTDILLWELKRCGFETEWQRVETAGGMIAAIEQRPWDIIFSDYDMPLFNGLDALRIVREKGIDLPFIIFSGKLGEAAAVEAMQAGANDYLLKGNLTRLKHAVLRALTEAEEHKQHRKMEQELILLKQAIDTIPIGVTITNAAGTIIYTNPAEAQMHGFTVAELLDMDPRNLAPKTIWNEQKVPLDRYVTSIRESVNRRKDGTEFPVQLISLPVTNSKGIPIGAVTVCEDITDRKDVERKLLFMSTHDALTGLYNRAYFEHELLRLDHSRHFPVSVIMMDVNGLKSVNDREGHQSGDILLQEVGKILMEMFRIEDMVARIGGDEFIVLLPETDSQTVAKAVDRVRSFLDEGKQRVSLALGTATASGPGMLLESVKEADMNMYQDKLSRCFTGREKRIPVDY
jgi:diguanylate cyclase (GGDEF)-like protein/PAS domain S-box-containing protein